MLDIKFPIVSAKRRMAWQDYVEEKDHSFVYDIVLATSYLMLGSSHAVVALGLGSVASATQPDNRVRYVIERMQKYTAFKSCTSLQEAICRASQFDLLGGDDGTVPTPSWLTSAITSVAQLCLSVSTVSAGVAIHELLGKQALEYHPVMTRSTIMREILYSTMRILTHIDANAHSLDATRSIVNQVYETELSKLFTFAHNSQTCLGETYVETLVFVQNTNCAIQKLVECVNQLDAAWAYETPSPTVGSQRTQGTLVVNEFPHIEDVQLKSVQALKDSKFHGVTQWFQALVSDFVSSTNRLVDLHILHLANRHFLGLDRCTLSYAGGVDVDVSFRTLMYNVTSVVDHVQRASTVHGTLLPEMRDAMLLTFGDRFQQVLRNAELDFKHIRDTNETQRTRLHELRTDLSAVVGYRDNLTSSHSRFFTRTNPIRLVGHRNFPRLEQTFTSYEPFTPPIDLTAVVGIQDLLQVDPERFPNGQWDNVFEAFTNDNYDAVNMLTETSDHTPLAYLRYVETSVIPQARDRYTRLLAATENHVNETLRASNLSGGRLAPDKLLEVLGSLGDDMVETRISPNFDSLFPLVRRDREYVAAETGTYADMLDVKSMIQKIYDATPAAEWAALTAEADPVMIDDPWVLENMVLLYETNEDGFTAVPSYFYRLSLADQTTLSTSEDTTNDDRFYYNTADATWYLRHYGFVDVVAGVDDAAVMPLTSMLDWFGPEPDAGAGAGVGVGEKTRRRVPSTGAYAVPEPNSYYIFKFTADDQNAMAVLMPLYGFDLDSRTTTYTTVNQKETTEPLFDNTDVPPNAHFFQIVNSGYKNEQNIPLNTRPFESINHKFFRYENKYYIRSAADVRLRSYAFSAENLTHTSSKEYTDSEAGFGTAIIPRLYGDQEPTSPNLADYVSIDAPPDPEVPEINSDNLSNVDAGRYARLYPSTGKYTCYEVVIDDDDDDDGDGGRNITISNIMVTTRETVDGTLVVINTVDGQTYHHTIDDWTLAYMTSVDIPPPIIAWKAGELVHVQSADPIVYSPNLIVNLQDQKFLQDRKFLQTVISTNQTWMPHLAVATAMGVLLLAVQNREDLDTMSENEIDEFFIGVAREWTIGNRVKQIHDDLQNLTTALAEAATGGHQDKLLARPEAVAKFKAYVFKSTFDLAQTVLTTAFRAGHVDAFFTYPRKSSPHGPLLGNNEPYLAYVLYASADYMRDVGILDGSGYAHLTNAPFEDILRDLGNIFYRVITSRNTSQIEPWLWASRTNHADQASWVFKDERFNVTEFNRAAANNPTLEKMLSLVYTILRCTNRSSNLVGETCDQLIARAEWFYAVRLALASSETDAAALAEFGDKYYRRLQDESVRFEACTIKFKKSADSYRGAYYELQDAIIKNEARRVHFNELLHTTKPIDISDENKESLAEKLVIDAKLMAIQIEGYRETVRTTFNADK